MNWYAKIKAWMEETRKANLRKEIEEWEEYLRRNGADTACREVGRAEVAYLRAQLGESTHA